MQLALLPLLCSAASAYVTLKDAGDYHDLEADAADNALLQDYTIPSSEYIPFLESEYRVTNDELSFDHVDLSATKNDTSIIVADNGTVSLSYVNLWKEGYSSNLNDASFYGLNAVIGVHNGSVVDISNTNFTVHNGAAGIYSYGDGSVAYVSDASFYFSGPVSHALYAGGNGTVYGDGIIHYAGGYRSSAFSGDRPAGYIHVTNSVAHTTGVGSAIFYALGEIHAADVVGVAEKSPFLFSDGDQITVCHHCDLTAGMLGGGAIFSSSLKKSGSEQTFTNSKLTIQGDTIPAFWYGNIAAVTRLNSVEANIESGILAVANYSQITQDFDTYADYDDNSLMLPAEVDLYLSDSAIEGDIVAYNSSAVRLYVSSYSQWTGAAYAGSDLTAYLGVTLDSTSTWSVTADSTLDYLSAANVSLIESNGYTVYYNKSNELNSWIDGTVSLNGGGSLVAY